MELLEVMTIVDLVFKTTHFISTHTLVSVKEVL